MDITLNTATPVEIDTQMLREMSDQMWAGMKADRAMQWIKHEIASIHNYEIWNTDKWGVYRNAAGERMPYSFVMENVDTFVAQGNKRVISYRDEYFTEVKKHEVASANLDAINAEFNARGGWTRYYLVVSSSGHIHRDMNCFTCNNGKEPTAFALYPSLSGSNVEQAVAKLGAALCTHCFPEAPVEYREQVKISKTAAKILLDTADEAQFDAAIAKAAAKAATMCEGSSKPGIAENDSHWQKCTHCDYTARTVSMNGTYMHKLPRHKPYKRKAA